MKRTRTALIALTSLVPFAPASAQVVKRGISVPTLSWPGMLVMGAVLGVAGLVAKLRRR